MKNGRPRRRKKPMKKIIIACGLIVVGAASVALAYVTGDYSEYLAAKKEQEELVRELRILQEAEMTLITEDDYETVIPEKPSGDRREEIIQTKPPSLIESQTDEESESPALEDDIGEYDEDLSKYRIPDTPEDRSQAPDRNTRQVTGGNEAPTEQSHQIGQYTGVDLMAAKAKNSDFIAWLTIPGTKVDYPVVLTDNMDYYLTHGFTGKTSKLGTLFSLGKTDYKTPGTNIAIYGHHITDTSSGQKMFRPLLSYKQKSFWENHQTVYLDSLYHCGKYRIFAVINMVNDEWDPSTASFASTDEFMEFIRLAKSHALYETGVEVTMTDRIITLITCDRSFVAKKGRLVVMAVEQ